MSLSFEYHLDTFLILPLFALHDMECDNPQCGETHSCLSFGWLLWSIHFVWSNEC
jgi:hypothetical protein